MNGGTRRKVIDLFCGAGGMSLGFHHAGFTSVLASDWNKAACETFAANFDCPIHCGDVHELLAPGFSLPKADVVIGGPPCQGFSLLNRKKSGDQRRSLWHPYLLVAERSEAKVFVMENVPQLLGSPEHSKILETAESLGFTCKSSILLAANYGVPQRRKRAFIIGVKRGQAFPDFPPYPTHEEQRSGQAGLDGLLPWRTVRDAIGDLGEPEGVDIRPGQSPENLHFGRTPTEVSKLRYRAIPDEGMNREDLFRNAPHLTPECWKNKKGGTDLFGRLWWDRPAFTIRTEFFKPEKGRYLHPSSHRPITHREAARLQAFPDDFIFCGSKVEIARQIGNAVPPPLAKAIAMQLLKALEARIVA